MFCWGEFSTKDIKKIAPNLKWIHVISAGINHLYPFDWMSDECVLTNSSGVHAKKAGEFGLMSILMLQSHITKINDQSEKQRIYYLY